jgi:hypothetical protein
MMTIVCYSYDRRAFRAKLQQAQQVTSKVTHKQMPLIPTDSQLYVKSPFKEDEVSFDRLSIGEKIGMLEASVKDLKQDNADLQADVDKMSDNVLAQANASKTQYDATQARSANVNLILTIVSGIIALVGGSGGALLFKNRKIIKIPIVHKDDDIELTEEEKAERNKYKGADNGTLGEKD